MAIDPNEESNWFAVLEWVFLGIFTVEMLMRIVAQGFVLEKMTYLRDPWNILDFTVVLVGWFG